MHTSHLIFSSFLHLVFVTVPHGERKRWNDLLMPKKKEIRGEMYFSINRDRDV